VTTRKANCCYPNLHRDGGDVLHHDDVLQYGYAETSLVLIKENKLKKEIV
jgi:hypothetical protein